MKIEREKLKESKKEIKRGTTHTDISKYLLMKSQTEQKVLRMVLNMHTVVTGPEIIRQLIPEDRTSVAEVSLVRPASNLASFNS